MKKKFLLFPLLMFLVGSCRPIVDPTTPDSSNTEPTVNDPTTSAPTDSGSDPVSSDPTDSASVSVPSDSDLGSDTGSNTSSDPGTDPTDPGTDPTDPGTDPGTDHDPDEKAEIDPSELNAAVGFDVYSLLPKIYSEDYKVSNWSDEDYPIDVYIDLFDWSGDDVDDYDAKLALLFDEGGMYDDYEIQENLYIYVVEDFGDVYINIYSFAELVEKAEIDPSELNAAVGFDVYSLLPKIYSEDYEVSDEASTSYPIDVYVDFYDWTMADVYAYDAEMELILDYVGDGNYEIVDNLYIYVNYYFSSAYINIYSLAAPVEKDEIDEATIDDFNTAVGFDVYSILPPIYSNNYFILENLEVEFPSFGFESGTALYLMDWIENDVYDYMDELDLMYLYDYDDFSWLLDNDYRVGFLRDSGTFDYTVYALIVYSYGEPADKLEIDADTIAELNDLTGVDVYSILPPIYSNDYELYNWSDEDYPVDVYLFLDDWSYDDYLDYVDALEASDLEYEFGYGYKLGDNLYLLVDYYGYGEINIYSDANYSPFLEVDVWPAAVINDFFGSEAIGSLVPSFESDNAFLYKSAGEGDEARLVIATECINPNANIEYAALLEDAGWIVDDSLFDWLGIYFAYDVEENISLIFSWVDGYMIWNFAPFADVS